MAPYRARTSSLGRRRRTDWGWPTMAATVPPSSGTSPRRNSHGAGPFIRSAVGARAPAMGRQTIRHPERSLAAISPYAMLDVARERHGRVVLVNASIRTERSWGTRRSPSGDDLGGDSGQKTSPSGDRHPARPIGPSISECR